MSYIGRRIKLGVNEPWEINIVVDGIVSAIHYTADGDIYFAINDSRSGDRYIVARRYHGDNITEVFLGKMVIVAVAVPKTEKFDFGNPNFLDQLTYFGIGYIVVD